MLSIGQNRRPRHYINAERVSHIPVPMVTGILETAIYVDDLGRSEEFYRRIFGFERLLLDARMCALQVPASGVLLIFLKAGSLKPSKVPGGVIPPHGGEGVLHLCFAISLAELDHWTEHLARNDVAIESRVVQHFGGISLYFRDPDGHSVEVATPGLWQHY